MVASCCSTVRHPEPVTRSTKPLARWVPRFSLRRCRIPCKSRSPSGQTKSGSSLPGRCRLNHWRVMACFSLVHCTPRPDGERPPAWPAAKPHLPYSSHFSRFPAPDAHLRPPGTCICSTTGNPQGRLSIFPWPPGHHSARQAHRAPLPSAATACTAIPSLRPVKPSFSVVVAFTKSVPHCNRAGQQYADAWRRYKQFEVWQITVRSALPSCQPAAVTS